ncbi:202_t:CDS:2, partial [Racocetra fulgida]
MHLSGPTSVDSNFGKVVPTVSYDTPMDPITKPRSRLSGVIKPPKILNPNLYKASKALESGHYHEAKDCLTRLIKSYPNSYSLRCDRGLASRKLGNLTEALHDFDYAIKKNSVKSRALLLRGETFYYKKDYESAKNDLNKGFSSFKADDNISDQLLLSATRIYGEIMVLEENYYDALDCFNRVLKSSPYDSTTLRTRGQINIKLQRYLDALDDFNAFLKIEPDNPDVLNSRGSLFKKLGRYDAALEDYTKAMKVSKRIDFQLLLNRGKVYQAQARYEEALRDFNELLKLKYSDVARIFRNRARAYRCLSRYQEALSDYTEAIKFDRKASTYRKRAEIYHTLLQPTEALSDLDQALMIDPLDKCAESLRNQVYAILKKYDDALGGLNKILNDNPFDITSRVNRGEVLRNMKQYTNALIDLDFVYQFALQDYNLAVQFRPESDILILSHRAKTLQISTKWQESLADWNQVLKISPKNVEALENRAHLLFKLLRYEEALVDLDNALSIDPTNFFSLCIRSEVYHAIERYEEALEDLNKAHSAPNCGNMCFVLMMRGEVHRALGKNKEAMLDLTVLYRSTEQYQKALEDLNKVLEADPTNFTALCERSIILRDIVRRYDEAWDDLEMAFDMKEENFAKDFAVK